MATRQEDVSVYALRKLLRAVEQYFKAFNQYPMTEKGFDELSEADVELIAAQTLAKEVLGE